MTVHKKLMQARIKLQGMELKKSGENKFAGYKYFELGDFLPQTMQIFHDLGLASVVSFDTEYARLCITDCEDGTTLTITSPMAEANLKGAHPIQNLGAVESYQRRYLWLCAMEIVEHDIIDASEPQQPAKPATKPAEEQPSRPTAKPAEQRTVAPRPPSTIKGQEGAWQLKVTLEHGGDVQNWLGVIDDACKLALEMTQSHDDVMAIFKKNKQLFDEVKKQDAEFFKGLMAKFTEAKKRFAEEA
jgi:hypothetical protein